MEVESAFPRAGGFEPFEESDVVVWCIDRSARHSQLPTSNLQRRSSAKVSIGTAMIHIEWWWWRRLSELAFWTFSLSSSSVLAHQLHGKHPLSTVAAVCLLLQLLFELTDVVCCQRELEQLIVRQLRICSQYLLLCSCALAVIFNPHECSTL